MEGFYKKGPALDGYQCGLLMRLRVSNPMHEELQRVNKPTLIGLRQDGCCNQKNRAEKSRGKTELIPHVWSSIDLHQ